MSHLIREIEKEFLARKTQFPDFKAGDTVNVHVKIREGNKERIQQFQGIVVQRRNMNSAGETFTVRKVSNGIGVERIFPILSPNVDKIEMIRKGDVRRARLFYLRGKQGKAARIKERLDAQLAEEQSINGPVMDTPITDNPPADIQNAE
ncbi:MAG TPA: 50S ribosomal protein L19 [Cyclobacteriaceae bacterium]|nr:50S ribosomal protein L19 [Cyclobacteriaceae bacterium]